MFVERSDDTELTRYFHTDHLGSISVITDEAGAVLERLSYDAWGKRRFPDGTDDPSGSITSQTTKGFTGHEQLTDVGLVHMNGRVYDPLLARFGSADPVTEDPFSTQGWNRYSYVGNSPVNFTDPSGYCFMGCFWKPVFKAIGQFFQQSWGTILQIGATMLCGGVPVCAAAVAMITSTFVAGVNGGSLAQALRAGLLSGLKALAFYAVGDITSGFEGTLSKLGGHGPLAFGSPAHLVNMIGHAAVGCGFAVAEGGKCGPGAAAGAAGSFAGPLLTGLKHEASLVAHSVVGGLASVAGGGKFANGALTAAFGYLFNQAGGRAPNDRHTLGTLEAIKDAIINNYTILSATPTSATIAGEPNNRVYDFVMQEPGAGRVIGVEVKTSWWGIIKLNERQVNFDAAVANGTSAYAPALNRSITGVQYYTYCFMCGMPGGRQSVPIGSAVLWARLRAANVSAIPIR